MYAAAVAYGGFKIYYIRTILPVSMPDPIIRGIMQKAYAPQFDVLGAAANLGAYIGFALNGAYDLLQAHPQWRLAAAALWGVWWLATVLACGMQTAARRVWRVSAFGLSLFAIALAPVLVLPDHLFSYYVGIAAAGLALAVVATLAALPGKYFGAPIVATALAVALFFPTTTLVRNSEEMRFFWSFSRSAARWLYSLSVATPNRGVEEVVVPHDGVTDMIFREGDAHRVLLCAHYQVRRVADIGSEPSAPNRIFIREPLPLTRSAQRPWRWLMRSCRH
jgi:hypothetical protein